MRTRPAPASPLYQKIRFAFTDHPTIDHLCGTYLAEQFDHQGTPACAVTKPGSMPSSISNGNRSGISILVAGRLSTG